MIKTKFKIFTKNGLFEVDGYLDEEHNVAYNKSGSKWTATDYFTGMSLTCQKSVTDCIDFIEQNLDKIIEKRKTEAYLKAYAEFNALGGNE